MSTSFVDAKEPSRKDKDEHEEVEREMYFTSFEIYDESEDSDIDEGSIIQTSDSSFEISLSKAETHEDVPSVPKKEHSALNTVHTILDIAGFIPVLGAAPDLLNGLIYCCEGDFTNMGLALVAAVPLYGDTVAGVAKGVKYTKKIVSQGTKTGGKIASASTKRFINTEIKKQAQDIAEKAAKNNINSISLFWTNGTKFNAKAVAKEVEKINPNIKIKVLERSAEGVQLEKQVNRKLVEEGLRQGYTKEELFQLLKKNELWGKVTQGYTKEEYRKLAEECLRLGKTKEEFLLLLKELYPKAPSSFTQSLEALQRRKSILYAKSAKNSDWIIRFKQEGGKLGQASVEEQKILDKAHKIVESIDIEHENVLRRVLQPDGSTRIIPTGN